MKKTLLFAATLLATAFLAGSVQAEVPSSPELILQSDAIAAETVVLEEALPELAAEAAPLTSNVCLTNCLRKLNTCLATCGSSTACQTTCQNNFLTCVC